MTKETYRLIAVAAAGAVAVLLAKVGPDNLMSYSGRPTADQLSAIIAAIGGALAWWKGRDVKPDDGGGQTLDLLQALKRIIEQFKTKGVPDEMSVILKWGDEVYELDWKRRTKPEPK